MSRRKAIAAGQVWVASRATARGSTRSAPKRPRTVTRTVLAVIEDKISYTVGGPLPRYCQRRAFLLWARTYSAKAKATHRQPPPLQLVAPPSGRARRAK